MGLIGRSTSVVADGVESAGDVFASGLVMFGIAWAARPADENHPTDTGRIETLIGLMVGLILVIVGIGICTRSLKNVGDIHPAPAAYTLWPLLEPQLHAAGNGGDIVVHPHRLRNL